MADTGFSSPAPEPPPVSYLPAGGRPDLATTDVPCISCGYNLRGLFEPGSCPECGTPIARSLMGNLLAFSNPGYIESLRLGATIIRWSILLLVLVSLIGIGGGISVFVVGARGKATPPMLPFWLTAMIAFVGTAGNLGFYGGWWLLSAPDPAYVGRETGATHRRVLRVCAAICAVFAVGNALAQIGTPLLNARAAAAVAAPGTGMWGLLALVAVVGLASLAAWAVMYFASMRYVRWLAPRLPDAWVDERAKMLTWLGPLLYIFGCGVGAIVALVFYWNLIERIRTHLTEIRAAQRR